MIIDQNTGRSKGYAFFEFSNYKEFCDALKIEEPLIFGKQKLVLNSAKNRYDYEDDKINKLNSITNKLVEDRKNFDNLKFVNQNALSTSMETGLSSSKRNSKDSSKSHSSGNSHSFLGDKVKRTMNYCNSNNNNELQLQIRNCLVKLSEQYYRNKDDIKSSLFNYYCSNFFHFKKNVNKTIDNYNEKND